jgi:hypothetical protein
MSGLFNTSDYGAKGYQSAANDALHMGSGVIGQQGGIASQYGQNAATQGGLYGQQQTNATGANNAYDSYLGQNQSTDQNFAGRTAANLGNYENSFAQQGANAQQGMFNRGLDTPESGGQSGPGSSIQAYLSAQKSLGVLGAQQTAANQQYAANGQRLGMKSNFDNGLAGQSYGREMGALGAQNGVYGQQFGEYGRVADQNMRQAEMSWQKQAGDNQEIGGLIGGVASIYGMSHGMPPMGGGQQGGGGGYNQSQPYAAYDTNQAVSNLAAGPPSYQGSIGGGYGAQAAGSYNPDDVNSFFAPSPNYSSYAF